MKYQRIPYKNGDTEGFRYLKNNKLTKESRIPHDVMDKFSFTDTVEFDFDPKARLCIFCDSPQTRQRVLNSETVELCEWHYHNTSLGKIAQQVRELKEYKEKQAEKDTSVKGKVRPRRRRTSLVSKYV